MFGSERSHELLKDFQTGGRAVVYLALFSVMGMMGDISTHTHKYIYTPDHSETET